MRFRRERPIEMRSDSSDDQTDRRLAQDASYGSVAVHNELSFVAGRET